MLAAPPSKTKAQEDLSPLDQRLAVAYATKTGTTYLSTKEWLQPVLKAAVALQQLIQQAPEDRSSSRRQQLLQSNEGQELIKQIVDAKKRLDSGQVGSYYAKHLTDKLALVFGRDKWERAREEALETLETEGFNAKITSASRDFEKVSLGLARYVQFVDWATFATYAVFGLHRTSPLPETIEVLSQRLSLRRTLPVGMNKMNELRPLVLYGMDPQVDWDMWLLAKCNISRDGIASPQIGKGVYEELRAGASKELPKILRQSGGVGMVTASLETMTISSKIDMLETMDVEEQEEEKSTPVVVAARPIAVVGGDDFY